MTPFRSLTIPAALALALGVGCGPATAQKVISLEPQGQARTDITAPPSVGNGIANGVVKSAGAPSVGNGIANGIVKRSGAPSVDDGIANGVVKSTTINQ